MRNNFIVILAIVSLNLSSCYIDNPSQEKFGSGGSETIGFVNSEKEKEKLEEESKRIEEEKKRIEEEERRKKLAAEKRQQRELIAENLIGNFTTELMNRVSPVSGENPRYTITSIEYDESTEKIELLFQSTWMALVNGWEDIKESHELETRFTLYGDGLYYFEEIGQNNALRRAIEATKNMELLGEILTQLSKD